MTEHPMTEATPLASEQITQALSEAFKLIDNLASEMNGAVYPHDTKDADDIAMDLADAFGMPFNEHWASGVVAALSASPAPSGQGVSGEVLLPAEPGALAQSIATIEAWERSGDHLGEIENEVALSESICLCLHELKRLRTLAAPAPSCAPGEVERAKVLWQRACVGREGYCSSDLQDAAIEAIKQAFREAEAAARSATLPAHYQWSDGNREKFDFGRDSAADAIAALNGEMK